MKALVVGHEFVVAVVAVGSNIYDFSPVKLCLSKVAPLAEFIAVPQGEARRSTPDKIGA